MLERLSPPAFAALTAQELADWIRIDVNSEADSTNILLESATEYVEGITGLAIGLADYRLTVDCYAGNNVRFPISPIQSVVSVNITTAGTTTTVSYRMVGTTLLFDDFHVGEELTVEFTAGYPMLSSTPAALRQAVAVLVSAGYNSRETIDDQTFRTVANLCARYRRYA